MLQTRKPGPGEVRSGLVPRGAGGAPRGGFAQGGVASKLTSFSALGPHGVLLGQGHPEGRGGWWLWAQPSSGPRSALLPPLGSFRKSLTTRPLGQGRAVQVGPSQTPTRSVCRRGFRLNWLVGGGSSAQGLDGWGPRGLRMKLTSAPHWPLPCFLVLLPWPLATPTSTAPWQCPPGEEPDLDPGQGSLCRSCPPGTFSASWGSSPCQPHSRCSLRGRLEARAGSAIQDTRCGDCQPGRFAPSEVPHVPCQPCFQTPLGPRGCDERRWRTRRGVEVAAGASSTRETRQPGNGTRAGGPEETAAQYAVIAIVPIFCLMGLLGILVCNLLKRKGYHCTAHKEVGPGPGAGGSGNSAAYRAEDANEDTIGVLVRLITEKKENAAALEELLKEYHSRQLVQTSLGPAPRLPPGPPSMPHICPHRHHLHTVQGLASLSGPCCSRCSQKKWPEVLLSPEAAAATTPAPRLLPNPTRAPKAGAKAGRQGEITILSVGRFRVARIPEQRTNSLASEVKTITEAGPSGADFTDSSQPGPPAEQRALLGSSGSHTKWSKPPAEKKAEENRYVVRLSESNLVI